LRGKERSDVISTEPSLTRTGEAAWVCLSRTETHLAGCRQPESRGWLGKAERLPFVELMAEQGMSTRAIASVVGTSHQTVANDLAGSGVKKWSPVKKLTPAEPPVADNEVVVEKNTTITGLDGKSYSRPSQAVPAEFGLWGLYLKAVYDLEKILARLKRLHADERFLDDREDLMRDCYDRLDDADGVLMCLTSDLAARHRCRDCEERLPIDSDLALTCEQCGGEPV